MKEPPEKYTELIKELDRIAEAHGTTTSTPAFTTVLAFLLIRSGRTEEEAQEFVNSSLSIVYALHEQGSPRVQ